MAEVTIELFKPYFDESMAQAMHAVMRSGQIAHGPQVSALERALEIASGLINVVALSESACAVELAFRLGGLVPGDEVLTTSYACLSSTAPIPLAGLTPVWVDLDEANGNMDPDDLRRRITPKSRAVLVVHTAGYPAKIDEIATIARAHDLVLIEDCNAAWGARYADRPVGSVGDYAVFSFYPNRQLGAPDGAALACKNPEHAAQAKRLRRFGIDAATFRREDGEINPQSEIASLGRAQTMSNLSAACLLAQLPSYPNRAATVQCNAALWRDAIQQIDGIAAIPLASGARGAYWVFLLLCDHHARRDAHMRRLKAAGVQCAVLHTRTDQYAAFGGAASLPATDAFMNRVLALPCGWWVTAAQIEHMAALLADRRT